MTSELIITQVVNNLNRADFTRVSALQYLNNRIDQICNFDNYSFMEETSTASTVAAQQTYTIPGDYKDQLHLLMVDGTQKTPLTKWVGTESENSYSNTATTGKPYAYWVWQDAYNLYPIPDGVYTLMLKYYRYIPDITDVNTEENELCQRWPDLLINGATSDGFHYFMQSDKVAEWETKWTSEFQKLIRRQGKRKTTNYTPRIRVRVR